MGFWRIGGRKYQKVRVVLDKPFLPVRKVSSISFHEILASPCRTIFIDVFATGDIYHSFDGQNYFYYW